MVLIFLDLKPAIMRGNSQKNFWRNLSACHKKKMWDILT